MEYNNAEKRIEAKRLYLEEDLQLAQIAERLGVPSGTVRTWKSRDVWPDRPETRNESPATSDAPETVADAAAAGGAVAGVVNAERSETPRARVGGNWDKKQPPFPKKNQKATIHGLFARYLPDETRDILQQIEDRGPIDVLWDQIQLAYAALIRAQQIMHVKDRNDVTETKVGFTDGSQSDSERWEVQQAWDKQASFLKAQAQAQATLSKMLQQYDDLCRSELATEEQKARIASINLEMEIARERLALDQRKAGMGDDIEHESGIALLPDVDEALLATALPDPGQSEAVV